MMLVQAGVPHKDVRVPFGEWKNFKDKKPYDGGMLPICFSQNGKKLT